MGFSPRREVADSNRELRVGTLLRGAAVLRAEVEPATRRLSTGGAFHS
jgi:hypothetical protein